MRYIASLISGVGIFMMGAGLSWYHGIMGLLHPEPIQSLLWVSVLCWLLSVIQGIERIISIQHVMFLCYRLTVSWPARWCLKEVGYEVDVLDLWWHLEILLLKHVFLFSFPSHVTSCRQWDKEERPPARTFFLWIWYVQLKSYNINCCTFFLCMDESHLWSKMKPGDFCHCTQSVSFSLSWFAYCEGK